MPGIKFIKVDPKAIVPKSEDKIHYPLQILDYDGEDVGINGNTDDTLYYFRTGLRVEIPNGHCLYLHQAVISPEKDSLCEGLTFKDKVSIIYPDDPGITIVMKRRNLPENKELNAKMLEKLSGKWVGNLVLRKNTDDVYISFTQFCCYDYEHLFNFILIGENIRELNLLIDALIPGIHPKNKHDCSFSFQALDTNFVAEEIDIIEKLHFVTRYNYKIKKFTDKFLIELLEKFNPNKNFDEHNISKHKSAVIKAIRQQIVIDSGIGYFLKNYSPHA